jgi:hypothetical protein
MSTLTWTEWFSFSLIAEVCKEISMHKPPMDIWENLPEKSFSSKRFPCLEHGSLNADQWGLFFHLKKPPFKIFSHS